MKKNCIVCFDEINDNLFSNCNNCKDNGIICHTCELSWTKKKKNPSICIICKQKTRNNISEQALYTFFFETYTHHERVYQVTNSIRNVIERRAIESGAIESQRIINNNMPHSTRYIFLETYFIYRNRERIYIFCTLTIIIFIFICGTVLLNKFYNN